MKWVRFPRVLGVVVCLYLVAMSVVFGYLSVQSYRFVHNATAVQGTVVAMEVRPAAGSNRQPSTRLRSMPTAPKVRYVVGGQTYYYTAAHGKYHPRTAVGSTVTVLYDADNPSDARLKGEGRILIPLITSGFVTSAIVLGFVLFLTRNTGRTAAAALPAPAPDEADELEHGTHSSQRS